MKKNTLIVALIISLFSFSGKMMAQSCAGSATLNVTIAPAMTVNGTVVNAGCGGSTGSITTNVSGGSMPYGYLWSNNATTPNLTNLAAGTYIVTVTSANGCTKTGSFMVSATGGSNFTLRSIISNSGCGPGTGSISIGTLGGTPPFTYAWSNGATTSTISNLIVGTYSVTVTATGGCTASGTYAITNDAPSPNIGTLSATCNSVTFNWSGPNTGSYEVKYKVGSTESPITNVGSAMSHTFTGLNPMTTYKVYVRYRCPNNKKSGWVSKSKKTPNCLTSPEPGQNNLISSFGDAVLNVYPNPAADEVNIAYSSENTETAQMTILNALGQTISTRIIPAKGELFQMSTVDLLPGFYWVNVSQGNITRTTKLLIQR